MKRVALSTLSLALLAAAGAAQAQSSVTLYGTIDTSLQYVSNDGGHSLFGMGYSNLSGSKWGLKGTEDLGGGLKTIFQLENGFNPTNGTLGQGGKMFGRQAYVGLTSDQYGTLTLGRQYDTTTDLVQPITADNYFSSIFATPGDVDNNDNSARFNNVVKYTSPVLNGFQFAGMYALGGVAGATGSGQTWGAAATYGIGSLNIAAGYLSMDNASSAKTRAFSWASSTADNMNDNQINAAYQSAKSIGIAQVAAQYVAGPFTIAARYSNAQYKPDAFSAFETTQRFNVAGAFLGYQLTPAALLGLGYTWTHGSGDTSNTYNQISLGGDYNLSKRTDLYALAAYQHASGTQRNTTVSTNAGVTTYTTSTSNAGAAIGSYSFDSATNSQTMVQIGIRHKF
jgi:predicted porin